MINSVLDSSMKAEWSFVLAIDFLFSLGWASPIGLKFYKRWIFAINSKQVGLKEEVPTLL